MTTGKKILALALGMFVLGAFVNVSQAEKRSRSIAHAGLNAAENSKSVLNNLDPQPDRLLKDGMTGLCTDDCYDDCCEDMCCGTCRCTPTWRAWGDFLYIRPRNAEVVYATPIDGSITPAPTVPVQFGRVANVDPTYEPTFRVGFARVINECASLGASYTQLNSNTTDSISVNAPIVLRPMVVHPARLNATADGLDASASYDLDYKLADIEYRRTFISGCRHYVSFVAGVSYGHLNQELLSTFEVQGVETVNNRIKFDGGGIRLGLEAERMAPCSGWLVYGRANARFLGGEFSARYQEGNTFDTEIVDAQWKAGRVVPVLDIELGFGWATPSDCLRFTAGYMFSGWYNTVTTTDFISGVQNNDFSGLHDTLTFDGLVIRTEIRY